MQRVTFNRKNVNAQRPRVDRFVAPRVTFPELRRRMSWTWNYEHNRVDIWHQEYLKKKKYIAYLDHALGLEPMRFDCSKERCKTETVESWPCIPRTRGYLSSADSILDLPSYKFATFPDLLDWSNENILVAALGRQYHKWSWQTQSLINPGSTEFDIHCCKFNPRGDLLLLGTDNARVEVHDYIIDKMIAMNTCLCGGYKFRFRCSITALDWSPTGKAFITGCSEGMLTSFDQHARLIHTRRMIYNNAVIKVLVSPDARFVAAATVSSAKVALFTWPELKTITVLTSLDWTVKTLAWHPWRSALLGIGVMTFELHSSVMLWDVAPSRVREVSLGHSQRSLDVMQFSCNTGELVLSLCNIEPEDSYQEWGCQLVVMSDPETVVDQWNKGQTGLDRIRTMVFSPDGAKLATATEEEDLIIWNFLPENSGKKNRRKKFSALPAFLDEVMPGHTIR
ncbi:hypothetical protein ACJJTC_003910 [Scirpophaga incertulas]